MGVHPRKGLTQNGSGLMRPVASTMAGISTRGRRPRMARVAVGVAIALVAVLLLGVAISRMVDLRYLNVPVLHPYPPAGYEQNPFNPTNRADLISTAEAAKVKADLLADGKIEVDAAATGDGSHLGQGELGRSLDAIKAIIQSNLDRGLLEKSSTRLDSVVAGHLADPNDATIVWCVEEHGTTTLTYLRRDDGAVTELRSFPFEGRFWVVNRGGRYLIADRVVTER